MENAIIKSLNLQGVELILNTTLPKFSEIAELFETNKIPYKRSSPDVKSSNEITYSLEFSQTCNFKDVYLMCCILKNYGIKFIYPGRKKEKQIAIGTYLMAFNDSEKRECAIARPTSILSFLSIDPKIDTKTAIQTFFKKFDKQILNNYENSNDSGDYHDYDNEADLILHGAFGGDTDAYHQYD